MVKFVKTEFKMGLGWASQGGSQKLFSRFNLSDVLKFKDMKMNFHELRDNFLKSYIENIAQWFKFYS